MVNGFITSQSRRAHDSSLVAVDARGSYLRSRQAPSRDQRGAILQRQFIVNETAVTQHQMWQLPSPWTGRGIGNRQETESKNHELSTTSAPSPCSFAQQTVGLPVLRMTRSLAIL